MTKNNSTHGFLRDPEKPRQDEMIGGGAFVFKRRPENNRIRPSQWPFEHGSIDAANAQAQVLAQQNPGTRFDVVAVVGSAFVPAEHKEAAE